MKRVCLFIWLGALVYPLHLFAQSPVGTWIDQDKDTFELYGQETISGKILSLTPPPNAQGKTLTDIHNPDPSKRKTPLVGSVFLRDFKSAGNGLWDHGTVYDARSGKTYSCTIQLKGNDALDLHGYYGVSLFGRTEHWKRLTTGARPAG